MWLHFASDHPKAKLAQIWNILTSCKWFLPSGEWIWNTVEHFIFHILPDIG